MQPCEAEFTTEPRESEVGDVRLNGQLWQAVGRTSVVVCRLRLRVSSLCVSVCVCVCVCTSVWHILQPSESPSERSLHSPLSRTPQMGPTVCVCDLKQSEKENMKICEFLEHHEVQHTHTHTDTHTPLHQHNEQKESHRACV